MDAAGGVVVDQPIHVDDTVFTALASAKPEDVGDRLAVSLAARLEEHAVDEMSEMSFPASDPPAVSPGTGGEGARPAGGAARDDEARS